LALQRVEKRAIADQAPVWSSFTTSAGEGSIASTTRAVRCSEDAAAPEEPTTLHDHALALPRPGRAGRSSPAADVCAGRPRLHALQADGREGATHSGQGAGGREPARVGPGPGTLPADSSVQR